MHPLDVIPISRTSSPYSLTEAVSDFTAYADQTNTATLNQSLNTLSATLDQIAPQLGPTFDAVSRLSQSLNNRNTSLADLFKSASAVTGILSERSQQVNKLILNSDDLLQVLAGRRNEIVQLLAATSAVSKQLSGLVHDNESKLAPALHKLNSVTSVLEKNRDNFEKAIPGLAKFQVTVGEAISSMYAYSAFVPNFLVPQLFQPFLDYLWGFRTFDTTKGPGFPSTGTAVAGPVPVQRCARVPRLYLGWTDRGIAVTSVASRIRGLPRKKLTRIAAVLLAGLLIAGAAVVVRHFFFGPKTITAYFTTATAIYPGDEVRVSGVKVGTIKSIEPQGTKTKMTLHVDHDVPIPADAKAVIVTQNLVAARYVELTPSYRTSGPVMADGAVIPRRSHGRSGGVGRGQNSIDAVGNGFGSERQGVDTVDIAVHRQRRQRARGW